MEKENETPEQFKETDGANGYSQANEVYNEKGVKQETPRRSVAKVVNSQMRQANIGFVPSAEDEEFLKEDEPQPEKSSGSFLTEQASPDKDAHLSDWTQAGGARWTFGEHWLEDVDKSIEEAEATALEANEEVRKWAIKDLTDKLKKSAIYYNLEDLQDVERNLANTGLTPREVKGVMEQVHKAWKSKKAENLKLAFDAARLGAEYARNKKGEMDSGVDESNRIFTDYSEKLGSWLPDQLMPDRDFGRRKALYPNVKGKTEAEWNFNFTKKWLTQLADNYRTREERDKLIDEMPLEEMEDRVQMMWMQCAVPENQRRMPKTKEELKEMEAYWRERANDVYEHIGFLCQDEDELWAAIGLSMMDDEDRITRAVGKLEKEYGRTREGQAKLGRVVSAARMMTMHMQGGIAWQMLKNVGKGVWEFEKARGEEAVNFIKDKLGLFDEEERLSGATFAVVNRFLFKRGADSVANPQDVIESDEFKELLNGEQGDAMLREIAYQVALSRYPKTLAGDDSKARKYAREELYGKLSKEEIASRYISGSKEYLLNRKRNIAAQVAEKRYYENEWWNGRETAGEIGGALGYMAPWLLETFVFGRLAGAKNASEIAQFLARTLPTIVAANASGRNEMRQFIRQKNSVTITPYEQDRMIKAYGLAEIPFFFGSERLAALGWRGLVKATGLKFGVKLAPNGVARTFTGRGVAKYIKPAANKDTLAFAATLGDGFWKRAGGFIAVAGADLALSAGVEGGEEAAETAIQMGLYKALSEEAKDAENRELIDIGEVAEACWESFKIGALATPFMRGVYGGANIYRGTKEIVANREDLDGKSVLTASTAALITATGTQRKMQALQAGGLNEQVKDKDGNVILLPEFQLNATDFIRGTEEERKETVKTAQWYNKLSKKQKRRLGEVAEVYDALKERGMTEKADAYLKDLKGIEEETEGGEQWSQLDIHVAQNHIAAKVTYFAEWLEEERLKALLEAHKQNVELLKEELKNYEGTELEAEIRARLEAEEKEVAVAPAVIEQQKQKRIKAEKEAQTAEEELIKRRKSGKELAQAKKWLEWVDEKQKEAKEGEEAENGEPFSEQLASAYRLAIVLADAQGGTQGAVRLRELAEYISDVLEQSGVDPDAPKKAIQQELKNQAGVVEEEEPKLAEGEQEQATTTEGEEGKPTAEQEAKPETTTEQEEAEPKATTTEESEPEEATEAEPAEEEAETAEPEPTEQDTEEEPETTTEEEATEPEAETEAQEGEGEGTSTEEEANEQEEAEPAEQEQEEAEQEPKKPEPEPEPGYKLFGKKTEQIRRLIKDALKGGEALDDTTLTAIAVSAGLIKAGDGDYTDISVEMLQMLRLTAMQVLVGENVWNATMSIVMRQLDTTKLLARSEILKAEVADFSRTVAQLPNNLFPLSILYRAPGNRAVGGLASALRYKNLEKTTGLVATNMDATADEANFKTLLDEAKPERMARYIRLYASLMTAYFAREHGNADAMPAGVELSDLPNIAYSMLEEEGDDNSILEKYFAEKRSATTATKEASATEEETTTEETAEEATEEEETTEEEATEEATETEEQSEEAEPDEQETEAEAPTAEELEQDAAKEVVDEALNGNGEEQEEAEEGSWQNLLDKLSDIHLSYDEFNSTVTGLSTEQVQRLKDSGWFSGTKLEFLDKELAFRKRNKRTLELAEERLAAQGVLEPLPFKKEKKLDLYKYVSKDSNRLVLWGVYHNEKKKEAVATNGRELVVDRGAYDAKLAGKVIDKDGDDLSNKGMMFPQYHQVFPKGSAVAIDGAAVIAQHINAVKAKISERLEERNKAAKKAAFELAEKEHTKVKPWKMSLRKYMEDAVVFLIFPNGTATAVSFEILNRFAAACEYFGVRDLEFGSQQNPLFGQNENGKIVSMPRSFAEEGATANDHSFTIDLREQPIKGGFQENTGEATATAEDGEMTEEPATPPEEVRTESAPTLDEVKDARGEQTEQEKARDRFVERLLSNFIKKEGIEKWTLRDVQRMAKEEGIDGGEDKLDAAVELQELVELALVRAVRAIEIQEGGDVWATYRRVVALYESQPTLSARSLERKNKQQFSTPIPLSYLMGRFVLRMNEKGELVDNRILEPSAGNGLLTVGVPARCVHVNEISPVRLKNLYKLGYGKVTQQDGTLPFDASNGLYTAVLTNPPFGSAAEKVYDGLRVSGLEKQMMLNALDSMRDDGRAAIIIGRHMEYDAAGAIKPANEFTFFTHLYRHFNVVDVINVNGNMYGKQGTTYDVRVILLNGKKKEVSNEFPPVKSAKDEPVGDWDAFAKRMERAMDGVAGRDVAHEHEQIPVIPEPTREEQTTTETAEPVPEQGASRTEKQTSTAEKPREEEPATATEQTEAEPEEPAEQEEAETQPVPAEEGYKPTEEEVKAAQDKAKLEQGQAHVDPKAEKVQTPLGSASPAIGTVTPTGQAEPLKDVLAKFGGKTDEYVATRLGWSVERLRKVLAAEQIDGVALAIRQMEEGSHMFIFGDQTGIGKGRQAAAMLYYAVKHGKKPVFVTEKAMLFTDMWRDMVDLGIADEMKPFIVNNGEHIKDSQGKVLVSAPATLKDALKVMRGGKIPAGFNVVFATYSQFRGKDEGAVIRQEFLLNIAKDNFLVLDESHNAAAPVIPPGEKAKDQESWRHGTNYILSSAVASAKGTTFLSATWAKRAEHMSFYLTPILGASWTTRQGNSIVGALKQFGVPLQEWVSTIFTQNGISVRRERDSTGVVVDWTPIDANDAAKRAHIQAEMDKVSDFFAKCAAFQYDCLYPALNYVNLLLAPTGDDGRQKKSAGMQLNPVTGGLFTALNAVLFGLKAKEVAKQAKEQVDKGQSVVIAFNNTAEGRVKDAVAGKAEFDMPSFKEILRAELRDMLLFYKSSRVKKAQDGQQDDDNADAGRKVAGSLADYLNEEGKARYQELEEELDKMELDVPLSPIDVMKSEMKKAGLRVGELTGRQNELVPVEGKQGKWTLASRKDKKRTVINGFQDGDLDVVLLNRSGATGISLHADKRAKNQKPRVMIVVQAQLDVNLEVQIRGRIDRTGQLFRGRYIYAMLSAVPAEQRLFMMLRAKLRSLDANTTSSAENKANEIAVVDFVNSVGDKVVARWLIDNPEIGVQLRIDALNPKPKTVAMPDASQKQSSDDDAKTPEEVLVDKLTKMIDKLEELSAFRGKSGEPGDFASKVAARSVLLPVKEQERLFREVSEAFALEIQQLNETGRNPLKTSTLDLKAKELSRRKISTEISEGAGTIGEQILGKDVWEVKMECDRLSVPFDYKYIKRHIDDALGGKSGKEFVHDFFEKIKAYQSEVTEKQVAKVKAEAAKKIAFLQSEAYLNSRKAEITKRRMKDVNPSDAEAVRGAQVLIDREIESLPFEIEESVGNVKKRAESRENSIRNAMGATYGYFQKITSLGDNLPVLAPGTVVKVPVIWNTEGSSLEHTNYAVIGAYHLPKNGKLTQSAITFDVYIGGSTPKRTLRMSDSALIGAMIECSSRAYLRADGDLRDFNLESWDEKVKEFKTGRAIRYVFVGNLLEASDYLSRATSARGQVAVFTKDDGTTERGIVMGEGEYTPVVPLSSAVKEVAGLVGVGKNHTSSVQMVNGDIVHIFYNNGIEIEISRADVKGSDVMALANRLNKYSGIKANTTGKRSGGAYLIRVYPSTDRENLEYPLEVLAAEAGYLVDPTEIEEKKNKSAGAKKVYQRDVNGLLTPIDAQANPRLVSKKEQAILERMAKIFAPAGVKVRTVSAEEFAKRLAEDGAGLTVAQASGGWHIPNKKLYARLGGQVGTHWYSREPVDAYFIDGAVFICQKGAEFGDFNVVDVFSVDVSYEEFEARRERAIRRLVDSGTRSHSGFAVALKNELLDNNGDSLRAGHKGSTNGNDSLGDRGVSRNTADARGSNGEVSVYSENGEVIAYRIPAPQLQKISALHGSPHRFAAEEGAPHGRFDDSKMGTGEGAQAFGWGHYTTSEKGVAKGYANMSHVLTGPYAAFDGVFKKFFGSALHQTMHQYSGGVSARTIIHELFYPRTKLYSDYNIRHKKGDSWISPVIPLNAATIIDGKIVPFTLADVVRRKLDENIRELKYVIEKHSGDSRFQNLLSEKKRALVESQLARDLISDEFISEANKALEDETTHHVYTAEFDTGNEDERLLDWTKELTPEQIERIATVIEQEHDKSLAETFRLIATRNKATAEFLHKKGLRMLGFSPKGMSKLLYRAGFVGHKFPAQSHGRGDYSKGTNYVIYQDSELTITDSVHYLRNGDGGVMGWYDAKKKEVVVREGARVDTYFHELGWHATLDWARQQASGLYDKMMEYARNAPEAVKQAVRELYPELQEGTEEWLDEVGAWAYSAEFSGEIEEKLDTEAGRTWWESFKALITRMWHAMVRFFGGRGVDVEAIERMDFHSAIQALARAYMEEKTLRNAKMINEWSRKANPRADWNLSPAQKARKAQAKLRFQRELAELGGKASEVAENGGTGFLAHARRLREMGMPIMSIAQSETLYGELKTEKARAEARAQSRAEAQAKARIGANVKFDGRKVEAKTMKMWNVEWLGVGGNVRGWAERTLESISAHNSNNESRLLALKMFLSANYEMAAARTLKAEDAMRVQRLVSRIRAEKDSISTVLDIGKAIEDILMEKGTELSLKEQADAVRALLKKYGGRFVKTKRVDMRSASSLAEFYAHELNAANALRERRGRARIEEKIESLQDELQRAETEEQRQVAMISLVAYRTFLEKGLNEMSAGEVDILAYTVIATLTEGMQERERAVREREERAKERWGAVQDAVKESARAVKNKSADKGAVKNFLLRWGYGWRAMMNTLSAHATAGTRERAREAVRKTAQAMHEAHIRQARLEREDMMRLAGALLRAFGKENLIVGYRKAGFSAMVREFERLMMGTMAKAKGSERFSNYGRVLTWGQLIQQYAMLRQSEFADMFGEFVSEEEEAKMDEKTRKLYQRWKQRHELGKFLGENYRRFADELVEVYAARSEGIDAQSVRDFGLPLSYTRENYVPIVRDLNAFMNNPKLRVELSVLPASLIQRTHSRKDIDETADFFSVWRRTSADIAHYVAFGELRADIQALMGHKAWEAFREQMLTVNGKSFADALKEQLCTIHNGTMAGEELYADKATNYALRVMNTLSRVMSLGFNVVSATKQMSGAVSFSVEVGWKETLKALLTLPAIKQNLAELTASAGWEARYGNTAFGRIARMANARSRGSVWSPKALRAFLMTEQAAMSLSGGGDRVAVGFMGSLLYGRRKAYYYAQGLSEEEARERALADVWQAVDLTQQAKDVSNQGLILSRRRAITSLFTQFRTSPMQFLSAELEALEDAFARKDAESAKKLCSVLLHNHVVEPFLMLAISSLGASLLTGAGDDDDDDKDNTGLYLYTLLNGNIDAAPLVGWLVSWGMASAFLERNDFTSGRVITGNLPAVQKVEGLASGAKRVISKAVDEDSDAEDVGKATRKLLEQAVIAKHLFGIYDQIEEARED